MPSNARPLGWWPKVTPHLRWLAKDAAILLGVCLLGEGCVRLWAPDFAHQLFDEEYTGGFAMELNDDFYRGKLVAKVKGPGERRLLALGDSTTFGTGVAAETTFIAALGELYRPLQPGGVSVLNGGIEGGSVRDLLHAYQDQWAAYEPDDVIIALTPNMVSMALVQPEGEVFSVKQRYGGARQDLSLGRRFKVKAGRLVHSLGLPSFLSRRSQQLFYWLGVMNHNLDPRRPYGALLAYGYLQGDLPEAVASHAWELFSADLQRLVEAVSRDHRHVALAYIEPRFLLTGEMQDNQKNVAVERFSIDARGRIQALAESLHVKLADSRSVLTSARAEASSKGRYEPFYLLLDYAHLDLQGHAQLAAALRGFLP